MHEVPLLVITEGIQNKTLIMYSGKKKCNNHPPNSKRKKSQFPINNRQNDIITDQYNHHNDNDNNNYNQQYNGNENDDESDKSGC